MGGGGGGGGQDVISWGHKGGSRLGGAFAPPSLYVKKCPGFCMCFYKQISMIV